MNRQPPGHADVCVVPILEVRTVGLRAAECSDCRARPDRSKRVPEAKSFGRQSLLRVKPMKPIRFVLHDAAVFAKPPQTLKTEIDGHSEVVITFAGAGAGYADSARCSAALVKIVLCLKSSSVALRTNADRDAVEFVHTVDAVDDAAAEFLCEGESVHGGYLCLFLIFGRGDINGFAADQHAHIRESRIDEFEHLSPSCVARTYEPGGRARIRHGLLCRRIHKNVFVLKIADRACSAVADGAVNAGQVRSGRTRTVRGARDLCKDRLNESSVASFVISVLADGILNVLHLVFSPWF